MTAAHSAPPATKARANPYPPLIGAELTAQTSAPTPKAMALPCHRQGQITQRTQAATHAQTRSISSSAQITRLGAAVFPACAQLKNQAGQLIGNSSTSLTRAFTLLNHCRTPTISGTVHWGNLLTIDVANSCHLGNCLSAPLTPALLCRAPWSHANYKTALHAACHAFIIPASWPVLCRHYPAPPPAPLPPKIRPCAPPPPAPALPLALTSKAQRFKAYALPLVIACHHDANNDQAPNQGISTPPLPKPPTTLLPTQKGYVMHHHISAHLSTPAGDLALQPLAFSIKTDISSFCFSGQIELALADFHAIKAALNVPRGQEPMVVVAINDARFAFIGEEITHKQRFAHSSISLAGRSFSAHLSKDYAGQRPIERADLYASQIVAQQLAHLSIDAHFGLTDYLIAKDSYSAAGKSPIAVLSDIAKAAGGFLYSHPSKPLISLLPRYQAPAWQIKDARPDFIAAQDAITALATTHLKQPLYNTITLIGATQGGIIYRADSGQDQDAPVSNHALYSDQANMLQAGIALLSDSGNKIHYRLELPLSAAWPLAQLGSIWQIGAGGKKALVQSVDLRVLVNEGVVSSWQTVELLGHNDI